MQKLTSCLWFDNQAEEAVKFYTSVFQHSKVGKTVRYDAAGAKVSGRSKGTVMTIEFELNGQQFLALNGGPIFKFTEAISFVVHCENQQELDYYWQKLSDGGREVQCGWLQDKYGLSWQVVPAVFREMMSDPDPKKSQRAMEAILGMVKIDIAELTKAYEGK